MKPQHDNKTPAADLHITRCVLCCHHTTYMVYLRLKTLLDVSFILSIFILNLDRFGLGGVSRREKHTQHRAKD